MTSPHTTQEPDVESLRQLAGHSPLPSTSSSFSSSCSSSFSVSSMDGSDAASACSVLPSPGAAVDADDDKSCTARVLRVQSWWDEICDYFLRVQRADTEAERTALAQEMRLVGRNLRHILHALLRERRQACCRDDGSGGGCGADSARPSPATLRLSSAAPSETGSREDTSSHQHHPRSAVTVHTTAHAGNDEEAKATPKPPQPTLTPCYAYLFSLPHIVTFDGATTEAAAAADDDAAELSTQSTQSCQARQSEPAPAMPQPIATTFLMLCLYTKHNNPAGTRGLLLRFLTRLLHDADLTVAGGGARNGVAGSSREANATMPLGNAGRHACSLLQLHPSVTIVPLLDMIRQVAAALHPARQARDRSGGSVIEHSLLVPPRPPMAGANTTTATAGATPLLVQDSSSRGRPRRSTEHTDFVRFLCALAEKVEQIPSLATFFLTQTAWELPAQEATAAAVGEEEGENSGGRAAVRSSAPESFVLLQALLPYLTHDSSSAEWHARRETCRYALSAVLSLAKCPDVAVQDLVAAERSIITRTLIGASTTLVTLCKVPENDDSAVQLLYLIDVLRFWSALELCAPAVARQLGLHASVEGFTQTTLLPLLQSRDTHVYAAVCLVVAHAVTQLNSAWPLVTRVWLTAILATVVDTRTGRCVEGGAADYYAGNNNDNNNDTCSAALVSGGQYDGRAAQTATMTSFCNYYIVPHLTHSPALSEDDLVNCAVLGFSLTEWTATEASLVLLRSLAVSDPYHFMKYVFRLDMGTIAEMVAAAPHREPRSQRGISEATAPPVYDLSAAASSPRIELAECFSPRLRLPQSARAAAETVGHEVLARLLRIECNTPNAMLRLRTCVINPQCAALRTRVAGVQRHGTDEAEGSDAAGLVLPQRAPRGESAAIADTSRGQNVWLHHGVQRAPVTVALCDLLGHALSLPASVTLLLTELLTCLCLMPDLRVWYTLMDVEYGRLDHALHKLRALLEAELDKGATAAAARKAGDAQSATSRPRVRSGDGASDADDTTRARSESRNNSASSSITAGGLLRRWTGLVGGGGRRSESRGGGTMTQQSPASTTASDARLVQAAGGSTSSEGVAASDHGHTRAQLYQIYVEHVLPYVQEDGGGDGASHLSWQYQHAIAAERPFLDLCVNMEYFRIELDAVVGYVALSHNLMTLRFGESDRTAVERQQVGK